MHRGELVVNLSGVADGIHAFADVLSALASWARAAKAPSVVEARGRTHGKP